MDILRDVVERPESALHSDEQHAKLHYGEQPPPVLEPPPLTWTQGLKVSTFPVPDVAPTYAFDSRRTRIPSRLVSNFNEIEPHEVTRKKRRHTLFGKLQSDSSGENLDADPDFSLPGSKLGAIEIQRRLENKYALPRKKHKNLPQEDELLRAFRAGDYERVGMKQGGRKKLKYADPAPLEELKFWAGTNWGALELVGTDKKLQKFTATASRNTLMLKLRKKAVEKYLKFNRDVKYRYFKTVRLDNNAVTEEYVDRVWEGISEGGSVAGKWL